MISMKHHRISFFGQKSGLILDSAEDIDPWLFLKCIKKKPNGTWEKPSAKEGRNIKINLLEIIALMDLCQKQNAKWSTVHRYGQASTPITFEKQEDAINITLPGYNKQLKFPETRLFADLLAHIYGEKLISATGREFPTGPSGEENAEISSEPEIPKDELLGTPLKSHAEEIHAWVNEPIDNPEELEIEANRDPLEHSEIKRKEIQPPMVNQGEFSYICGEIMKRTAKAVAFKIEGRDQLWIPLSAINESLAPQANAGLWIKQWFIAKVCSWVGQNEL